MDIRSKLNLTGLSPESTYYTRIVAEDEPEWPVGSGIKRHKESTSPGNVHFETSGPPVAETFATHGLHGESVRVLGSIVPHGFDTHYHFQYGPTVAYGSVTPTSDAGSGGGSGIEPAVVGAGLPGLQAGETYHYRLVASSAAAGGVTEYGADRTLTVPAPAAVSAPAACANERFRVGPSAGLPDCRAYEQVTPVDKEGAVEPFAYGTLGVNSPGALLGEDGEHFMVSSQFTNWGAGTGKSPYFFARGEEGWQMTPGAPQPEAGIDHYYPQLYAPDLTSFAFAADWLTSEGAQSPDVEFKAGPPGGPYLTAAVVPRSEVNNLSEEGGWIAASQDFSKLILEVDDRALVAGHPSATSSGFDLYEYAGGVLHQVNVASDGKTIGACGATIADGNGEPIGGKSAPDSSSHAVSADGSRVFFEAVPGSDCSEPQHIYMRAGGETRDLGVYKFVAANADGSKVILEAGSGEAREVLLYETGSAKTKLLFTAHEHLTSEEHLHLEVSADLSVLYLTSPERLAPEAPEGLHAAGGTPYNLYRYDIEAGGQLRFVVSFVVADNPSSPGYGTVPDGRDYYFLAEEVIGLPAGEVNYGLQLPQLYRYDSAEGVVECVSCASSFDPEPRWEVTSTLPHGVGAVEQTGAAMPDTTRITADGSRAFFDTRSALVPQDVAGEVSLLEGIAESKIGIWEGRQGGGFSTAYSPHSQVYEWREDGIEGCAQLQGCIGLLSGDTGGYFVQLIGIAEEGRDVFFTTHSQLGPNDHDSQGDVYDARAGGGEPPTPPRPVECEGDSCSTPFAAPSDLTPSSATFQGAGDLTSAPPPGVVKKVTTKKPVKCAKGKTRNEKGQCVKVKKAKKQARARKSNHRRGK